MFILQPRNLGWSDNRNALLAAAQGEFVLLLGDDDLLPVHALERLSWHLSEHPGQDLVGFGYEVIGLDGKRDYSRHAPVALALQVGRGDSWREVFFYDVLPMWAFHPFTLCCRRTLAIGWGYDKRCGIGDDVFFLFRALDCGCRIDVLPDVLVSWRRVFKTTNGYINLSSSDAANSKARREIWLLTQKTAWRDPAVRELVGSERFARHFLSLPPAVAADVAALGRSGTPEALDAARRRWEAVPSDLRWQASKWRKLDRMRRVGGLRYSCVGLGSTLWRWTVSTMRKSRCWSF
jgi:glycosyltransferase involved in cell wall biosynthesis